MTPMSETNFDINPPMPITDYERVVRGVNIGYDLFFTLTQASLRALGKADLDLLVVGAGGGAEIERFLPENPAWRITGVDPSREMLDRAAAKAERVGVADRVTLICGSMDDVPNDRRFDAATCLFVLHFLPDDAKVHLLRSIRQRQRQDGLAVIVSGCRVDALHGALRDDMRGMWQQYGEMHGMPRDRMAETITGLVAQQSGATTEEDYRRLMLEAGFHHVVSVMSIMSDALCAWITR